MLLFFSYLTIVDLHETIFFMIGYMLGVTRYCLGLEFVHDVWVGSFWRIGVLSSRCVMGCVGFCPGGEGRSRIHADEMGRGFCEYACVEMDTRRCILNALVLGLNSSYTLFLSSQKIFS